MIVRLVFVVVATAVVSYSTVEAAACRARFQGAPSWTVSSQDGGGVVLSSAGRAASLLVECAVLPRILDDQAFAARIGEEEPYEAPPLSKFGTFRGRRWILPDSNKTEWWLTKDRYLVHLTLMMKNQPVQEPLAQEVEAMIRSLVVEAPGSIAAGAQPTIGTVRDPGAIENVACEFASKPEKSDPGIPGVVVGGNLDCEIWVNIDGIDERLRSSRRGACDRGWDLPNKGQRVVRTYSTGATRVQAEYRVIDACFVGDRCEYIKFDATFRVSKGGGTRVLRANGKCSW